MKVVELFSGIGSQAKALERIAKSENIEVQIVKTCEWNIHALVAYNLIHNDNEILDEVSSLSKDELLERLSEYDLSSNGKDLINKKYLKSLNIKILKMILNSIIKSKNLINVSKVKGTDIPNDVDLLTYSFPCQDLSNVGSIHGYGNGIDRDSNTRSGLLWEVERILEEKVENKEQLPRYLLLENVTALEAKRHEGNFKEWKDKLEELGYLNKSFTLNALDFGVPQNRKRLIMLSVFVGDNIDLKTEINQYFNENDLNSQDYIREIEFENKNLADILKLDYTNDKIKLEALEAQPNDTVSRQKIWDNNYKIVNEDNVILSKVQTITTKQDRHPNSGNIYVNFNNGKSNYRFLTPRECFILMGFEEKDYDVLLNNNYKTRGESKFFSRDVLYKLAGNSIVVDVLEQVFIQMRYIENNIMNLFIDNNKVKNEMIITEEHI